MATAIGLSMQLSASTSGLTSGLTEAEKLIGKLGRGAESAAQYFEQFRDATTGELPAAMQSVADSAGQITESFRSGASESEAFTAGMTEVVAQAQFLTKAFQEGAAITAQFATEEEKRAAKLERLAKLQEVGAIGQEAYSRALAEASGANAASAKAEQDRAATLQKAAQITEASLSAQDKYGREVQELQQHLDAGRISQETFNTAIGAAEANLDRANAAANGVASQAQVMAKALQEGASVTAQFATEEEKRSAKIERLGQLLEQGAVSQQTYDRAIAEASGANAAAAKAEKERADAVARAAQITESSLSAQDKYDREIQELQQHLDAGRISQETFNAATGKAKANLDKAGTAAKSAGKEAEKAGLQFSELSGIFSLLPGPLGGIASRISSFASAGQGLAKLFAGGGGLGGALSGLAGSVGALINPFTLAAAGAVGFGAAVVAIGKGVIQLEDRVEKLGNAADKLGASFEFVQVLETAAERTGGSLESLGGSFNRFLKGLDAAKSGEKAASEAFAKIGISAEDLASKSPEEVFKELSAGITAIQDPAARAAAAMAIFGKSGADLLPTFKAVAQSEVDLKKFLAVLTDVDKVRLDQFGASVDSIQTATRGLGQALLLPFVGLGTGVTQGAAEFTGGITAIVKPIGQILEPALTNIGRFIEIFLSGLGAIGRVVGAVLEPFGKVFSAISAALAPANDAVVDFFQAMQNAGVAVAEFIMEWSAIGIVAENIDAIMAAVKPFVDSFVAGIGTIIEYAQRIGTIIVTAFQKVYEAVAEFLGGAVETVGDAIAVFLEFTGIGGIVSGTLDVIGQAFGGLYESISGIIAGVGGFIKRVVEFAENWLGITQEVQQPIEAEINLDTTGPALAATQFYDEITKAVEATAGLGTEGFNAALKYQTALEDLAQLAAEGELSQEELKRAVSQTTSEFEKSIKPLQDAQKARDDAAKAAEQAAQQQVDADRKVADQLIKNQQIEEQFGGNKERAAAAESLLAVEREIGRVQAEQAAAASANDAAAETAAAARLAALDQAQAALRDTAEFGFNQQDVDKAIEKVREGIEKSVSDADIQLAPDAASDFFDTIKDLERQLDLKIIDPKQFEEASQAAQKTFDKAKDQAKKINDLQAKFDEERSRIQNERLEELAKVSQQSLQANDVRSSAGASEFLRLATGREDPAIEEYRKQVKKLEEIRREIAKANQQPVEMI